MRTTDVLPNILRFLRRCDGNQIFEIGRFGRKNHFITSSVPPFQASTLFLFLFVYLFPFTKSDIFRGPFFLLSFFFLSVAHFILHFYLLQSLHRDYVGKSLGV